MTLPLTKAVGVPRMSVAVVLLPALGVGVGQRVGAGDVQVILEQHHVGRLVRLDGGVEGDVGRHARRALGAGEQLDEDDAVALALAAGTAPA